MTSTVTPYVQYIATASQTVFTFQWAFFATGDIKVYQTPAGTTPNDNVNLLASNAYSISAPGPTGGTVTLNNGAGANDTITIVRNQDESSVATFNNGNFTPAQLNQSFDNIIYMVQGLSQTLYSHAPTYDNSQQIIDGVDTLLPQLQANQIWVMNSNRTGIVGINVPNGVFSGGTVTSISAGAGLAGGTITVSGTISVASQGIIYTMMQNGPASVLGGYNNGGAYTPITFGPGSPLSINSSNQLIFSGGAGTGTVTSVATGTGLTGGTITGSGTISVAAKTPNTLAGYDSSGTFSDVAVGSGLTLSGGTLSASGGGSGGVVKLAVQAASTSASINFLNYFSATYSSYVIVVTNVQPGTAGHNLQLNTTVNAGTNWLVPTNAAWNATQANSNFPGTSSTTAINLQGNNDTLGTSTQTFNGTITINGYVAAAGNPSFSLNIFWHCGFVGSANGFGSITGSARWTNSSAFNGIQFVMDSGNLTAGTFELYGILA